MKNPIRISQTLTTLVLILVTNMAFAQKNSLKLTGFSNMKLAIEYERQLKHNTSLVLGAKVVATSINYGLIGIHNDEDYKLSNAGIRFTSEYRRYLFNRTKAMTGLYLAPGLSLGYHDLKYGREYGIGYIEDGFGRDVDSYSKYTYGDQKLMVGSVGLKLGWQQSIGRFRIDLGVHGLGNKAFTSDTGVLLENGAVEPYKSDVNGFEHEFYLGVGFAF